MELWVRSSGKEWGPLSPATVEMMVDHGLIKVPFEISTDGLHYGPPRGALAAAVAPPATVAPKSGPVTAAVPVSQSSAAPPSLAPVPQVVRQAGALPPRSAGAAPAQRPVAPAIPPPQASAPPRVAPAVAPSGGPVGPPAAPSGPSAPPPAPRAIQAAPPRGRLEDLSAIRLYYLVAAAEGSGRLTLGEGDEAFELFFRQGTPQAVSCAAASLGDFLVAQNALPAADLAAALQQAPSDPVGALMASGRLNPAALFPLLQQHAIALLHRALLLERGPFGFDPTAAPPASGFPLGQRFELLLGAIRRIDKLSLQRRLGGRASQAARLTGSAAELRLTALETRLLGQLDGSRSLAELVTGIASEGETVLRLVFLLNELDRITWQVPLAPAGSTASAPEAASAPPADPPRASAPPPAPRPVPAAKPVAASPVRPVAAAPKPMPPKAPQASAPKPPAPAKPAEDPALLLARLKSQNHFERLGLPRSKEASPQLKPLFFQLAKRYHPDVLGQEAPEAQRMIYQDILSLLNESYGLLGDDQARASYIEELEARDQGVLDLDVEKILKSEEDFQRAIILVKAHKLAEAAALLDACIGLNAKEGEFYAWRGYARFLLATDKRAALPQALVDIKKALTLSPRCAPAHFLEGQMQKLVGDVEAAKRAFKRGLELEPGNLEAQRELRLYEQRKQ
ncbi:MAG: DUF4388 domain-containing protein [Deltaproteobacteria bacterium]